MADSVQRMRYYTGQFLQKEDFAEEQAYHLDRLRRHLRQLHTYGIAEGLTVTANVGDSSITVQPGTAIDNEGRPIVLVEPRTVQLGKITGSVLAVISYHDEDAFPAAPTTSGDVAATRCLEIPDVEVILASGAPPRDVRIQLAGLHLSNGRIVEPQDTSVRTAAGSRLGPEITAERIRLKRQGVALDSWPVLSSGAPNQADVKGSLSVTDTLDVKGNIVVAGKVNGRNVSDDGAELDKLKGSFFPGSSYLKRALGKVLFTQTDAEAQALEVEVGFQPKLISMEGTFVVHRDDAQGDFPLRQHLGGPLSGFCLVDDEGNTQQYGHGPVITHGYTNDNMTPVIFSMYSEPIEGRLCYMGCNYASSSISYYAAASAYIEAIFPNGFKVRLEREVPASLWEPAAYTVSMIFSVLG